MFDKEVVMPLLERRGTKVQITVEVVKAAATNWGSGKEIMTLLLDQRGTDAQILEEAIIAEAEDEWSGQEVKTLLLDRRGAKRQPRRVMESFSKFPQLPPEIRQMIWTLSLPSRRFILGRNRYERNVVNPCYPAALCVNHEARAVAQRYFKRPEYYDPRYSYHVDLMVDAFDHGYLRMQYQRGILLFRDKDFADYHADLGKELQIGVLQIRAIFDKWSRHTLLPRPTTHTSKSYRTFPKVSHAL
jgi:hypothetical protein